MDDREVDDERIAEANPSVPRNFYIQNKDSEEEPRFHLDHEEAEEPPTAFDEVQAATRGGVEGLRQGEGGEREDRRGLCQAVGGG